MCQPTRWRAAITVIVLGVGGPAARGGEGYPNLKPGLVVDARGGRVDGTVGWLDGGLGKTRYGSSREANVARLAQASLLLKAELGESLDVRLHFNLDAEPGAEDRRSRVGPIEAYLAYHPAWSPSFNMRARAGVFFPPLSLEHPGAGWTTAYTVTPSAVNTWVGEDLRATGGELTLVVTEGSHEITAAGGAFGWNDPAGTLLAWRGWAMHDRQTGLRDRLPLAPLPSIGPGAIFPLQPRFTAPGREVDHRPGFYGGGSWTWSGRLHVRGLYYDTRADMAAFRGQQYGWAMRFASAGVRLSLPGSTELVGQHLRGRSQMGRLPDGRAMVDVEPRASFVLLTGSWGRHRVSVRRDWFDVEDMGPTEIEDDNREDGSAWTAAYLLRTGDKHRLALEAVRVDSTRDIRPALGLPARAQELLLQLSFRLTL
jgi:hypothetical protein